MTEKDIIKLIFDTLRTIALASLGVFILIKLDGWDRCWSLFPFGFIKLE